ncbi:decorin-binding protein DbpA [Borreliella burgdorferi]|uniref:Decorin binding protein A n=4 Tax=Borreliella burgdorferi TaxID=139 RepID=Q9R8B6_BORBG|nr:decorin-binding protein DbpA [Borreliella burgdorferi]AAC70184.1 decorin binding protein A [Borreliella burgdorferi]ACL33813.1 decorin binding protein A [Borreliella burgdorferi 156a]MDK7383791.1 decorin-binding protein DbpA [Borreliella burgdorferi]PRQ93586.1 cytochrome D ubiquinol oxidase subunit II [Borreliella burgdorferi]PRR08461.1 cytochrome D ubiquinol oxidase subunit II [Borreliella burgdorferi]
MIKCNNKTFNNLLKLTILVNLLISCGLTGATKIKLESSAKAIVDEIDAIKKEAASMGVNFDAFKDKKTGSGVSENPFILEAKVRATTVAEKFVIAIEEEATKLKETGSSGEFSAMYDLMFEVSKPLQELGIQEMTKTVSMAAEENPPTTAQGVLEIAKKMREKLQRVHKKNQETLKKKNTEESTAKSQ